MTDMDKRKAFEAWWESRPGTWRGFDHDLRFEVWKAATEAERERAAKVCEEKHANGNWKHDTRHECAEAIRKG